MQVLLVRKGILNETTRQLLQDAGYIAIEVKDLNDVRMLPPAAAIVADPIASMALKSLASVDLNSPSGNSARQEFCIALSDLMIQKANEIAEQEGN